MQRRILWSCAILVLGIVPSCGLGRAREKARRTKCMSNLKQIGVAIHVYSVENEDRFPKTLAELFPRFVQDGNLYVCPTAHNAKPIDENDLTRGAEDATGVFTEANTDYVYVSGMTSAYPPSCVLVYDKKGNHGGDGMNVLFLDGHVEWMSQQRLDAALARTRAVIKERAEAAE